MNKKRKSSIVSEIGNYKSKESSDRFVNNIYSVTELRCWVFEICVSEPLTAIWWLLVYCRWLCDTIDRDDLFLNKHTLICCFSMSRCMLVAYESNRNIGEKWEKLVSNSSLSNDLFFQLLFSQLKNIYSLVHWSYVNQMVILGRAFEINFNLFTW